MRLGVDETEDEHIPVVVWGNGATTRVRVLWFIGIALVVFVVFLAVALTAADGGTLKNVAAFITIAGGLYALIMAVVAAVDVVFHKPHDAD
jgi:hypothetical protein